MADLQQTLGKTLREKRLERKLTIRELGDQAGLSEIYVGEIERGHKYPSAGVLESLTKALGIGMPTFFELVAEHMRGFDAHNPSKRMEARRLLNQLSEDHIEMIVKLIAFLLSQQTSLGLSLLPCGHESQPNARFCPICGTPT